MHETGNDTCTSCQCLSSVSLAVKIFRKNDKASQVKCQMSSKTILISFGVVGKNPSMEDLIIPRSSLCTTVDHKTLKILPRDVNMCQRDNASMIALESVEWFNLQHIFFILDKAKAIPIRLRS